LRSRSTHPTIAAQREIVHKIGITGGSVGARIASAADDPTFLLAWVDVMAEYQLYDANGLKLEKLIHRVLEAVRFEAESRIVSASRCVRVSGSSSRCTLARRSSAALRTGQSSKRVYDPQKSALTAISS
jgi:hypothetical protein